MFEVTCPFCYHRINWLKLSFVCSGRHAPGSPFCEKKKDDARQAETGNEEPMYPVFPRPHRWLPTPRQANCPRCHGRTGQHACPACHTPLPPDFGGGFSPVIGLIGATRTGKTVYLTVGAHHLRTVLRDRFKSDVALYGDKGRASLEEGVRAIFNLGTLPPLTQPPSNGRSEPLVFNWRWRSRRYPHRYRNTYLSFLDTAGESLGTQHGVAELGFLTSVDAFIVLLDPFTLPRAAEQLDLPETATSAASNAIGVLTQVTQALRDAEGVRRGKRSPKPMAVVFAKVDAFRDYLGDRHPIFAAEADRPWHDETASKAMHDSVRQLLGDWGALDIDTHMESNYSNYRYFALSSLGRPPDYVGFRVAKEGVRPLRVADPLVWLLSHYKLVPRRHGDR